MIKRRENGYEIDSLYKNKTTKKVGFIEIIVSYLKCIWETVEYKKEEQ